MPGILPIFALTALGVAVLTGISIYATRTSRPPLATGSAIAAAAWAGVYSVALVIVSLSSSEQVLEPGEHKKFCGLYLDCHARVTVQSVESMERIGDTTAEGMFYVVTVTQSSDAVQAQIGLADPVTFVRDAEGVRYDPSILGQAALDAIQGEQPRLGRSIAPEQMYDVRFVFDLPRGVVQPRLYVEESHWAAALSEFFLIGDEDSFLHRKTVFALTS